VPRRRGGLFRKFADFVRDDRKTATMLARTRRFDRGVERRQVRLIGESRLGYEIRT